MFATKQLEDAVDNDIERKEETFVWEGAQYLGRPGLEGGARDRLLK
jgi:hypothetical protein